MKNNLIAYLKRIRGGLIILLTQKRRLTALVIISISLIFITACSNRAIPQVPKFEGDCRKDLDNLIKYYVLPIERSK